MDYLHSHGIIHRNLTPSTIFIDNDFPKLAGFDLAQYESDYSDEKAHKIKGTPIYLAPEIYLNQKYSKASDVYSFGLVMYGIMTGCPPFSELTTPNEIKRAICDEQRRPSFNVPILKAYRDLIERCWVQNPIERPTFKEILNELTTNPDFITDDVYKDEYLDLIAFINQFPITFDPSKRIKYFDKAITSNLNTFKDIQGFTGLQSMFHTETNHLSFDYHFVDWKKFTKSNIAKGYFYKIKKLSSADAKETYIKKSLLHDFGSYTQSEVGNFIREISIIPKLDHPSILKYVGYQQASTDKDLPSIIVEFSSNGTIYDFFNKTFSKDTQSTDLKQQNVEWNDTKKLIYLYGIAAGMAYLHSHNILHRDLKPNNVLLDDFLYPKITGFNISKVMSNETFSKSYKLKGTPVYLAPETYLNKGYSKSSDVYAFGLIIYEIISGQKPFESTISPKEIKEMICDERKRPIIPENMNKVYRDLIERCWSQDPKDRPPFESIVNDFKTNPLYLTGTIDEEEYFNYIKTIDDSPSSFDSTKEMINLDYISAINETEYYQKNNLINLRSSYDTEYDDIFLNFTFLDIHNYEKKRKCKNYSSSKVYEITDKQTRKMHRAVICKPKNFPRLIIENEIKIIGQINHPSLIRFIGYTPFDFKGRNNPILVTEIAQNGSLKSIIDFDSKNPNQAILNSTKKLIIIYGIASAMASLHSHGIIHGSLKPKNISLDEYLFPKISGFDESQTFSQNQISNFADKSFQLVMNRGNIFSAPEINKFDFKCPASDVFSFAFTIYFLVSNQKPFDTINTSTIEEMDWNNLRPTFNDSVPQCYKTLIEKCWVRNPQDRPTFDQILYHLKTNPEFITDSVNKNEFESYIKFIDNIQSNGNYCQADFLKSATQTFQKVKLDMKAIRNPSKQIFLVQMGSTDLAGYQKMDKIGSGGFGVVYKVLNKETNDVCAAKISQYEIDYCSNDIIINLCREIDIMSKLNHPSILQFVGFSPKNFKNKSKPTLITKLATNGALDVIIKNEKCGLAPGDWNDTKKLITIYGIAAGMAYMHNLDILHRDLKPANILLDDDLYPKIADFGLSKVLYKMDTHEKFCHVKAGSGFKGTYAYSAPEIIRDENYTKPGDVYAYGMIVYSIMTGETPFYDVNPHFLCRKVVAGERPKFKYSIPYCYKHLIQKCWSGYDARRPSFSDIMATIENDLRFITPNVNKDEFLDYVGLIKEYQTHFPNTTNSTKPECNIDKKAISKPLSTSNTLKIVEDLLPPHIENSLYLNMDKFERNEIISKTDQIKLYKFTDRETGQFYAGQISMLKINPISEIEYGQLTLELNKISKLIHPCLLKFIGYSPIDFKKQLKPVIVTEPFKNGNLSSILEIERINKAIPGWNDTKKLINIYGIAAGMAYLHSQGIIHKSLKSSTIYLDEILTPKIGDFGLSTRFKSSESITVQSISGMKESPIYSAPEVLLENAYSPASDVYSFAFIMYEIITSSFPFDEISNNGHKVFDEVISNQSRPLFSESVPTSYRQLIEQCWSHNRNERPAFEDIVRRLKTDIGFITDTVDSNDFKKYIDYINDNTSQKVTE